MSAWVIDVSDRDFETGVIERSRQVPVVVDFWAPWCGPCRALGPLLERLAEEYAGGFVLARVNVDDSPGLSQALHIQSIPMVLAFRDGRAVSEFVGALPETAVREFLRRVLPSEADQRAAAAADLLATGKVAEAEQGFDAALALEPRCEPALLGKATVLAERGDATGALALLERVMPGPLRAEADRLAAELRIRDAGGGDEDGLRARLAADPGDLATRFVLAQALAARGGYPEALDHYLEIVRRDRAFRDDAARKAMIDIFDLLGSGDATVERYRAELAKVLFR